MILALLFLFKFFLHLSAVAYELPRRRKLSETVPDHVFRHANLYEILPVVHVEHMTDHFRRNFGCARPCFDRRFSVRLHVRDLLMSFGSMYGPFFDDLLI